MGVKAVRNPVTDEHVAEFEQFVAHWQHVLGMLDWRLHRRPSRCSQYMAVVDSIEPEHRLARYRIGKDFGNTPVTSYTLSRVALHEVLHVMLYDLIHSVEKHGKDGEECLTQEHRIIHTLEPLLCPPENHASQAEGK